MKTLRILEALEQVNEQYITEATPKKRTFLRHPWGILAACLALVLGLSVAATASYFLLTPTNTPKLYFFDKTKYPVCGHAITDSILPDPYNWETMYNNFLTYGEGKNCLIVECTVTGGSFNILKEYDEPLPPSGHVLTPIRIDKIHYQESSVDIREGELCYLVEDFYYLDKDDSWYTNNRKDGNGIFVYGEYNPVTVGGKYVMFLLLNDIYYEHCGTPQTEADASYFNSVSNTLGIFQIADSAEVEQNLISINYDFWETWAYVLKTYAGYTVDKIPETPKP